jgi:AcrR family transcriptional regulator
VSEKTIFNYFPTKESLLFDREEDLADQLADAFGDRATDQSLVQIALDILTEDTDQMFNAWDAADEPLTAMVVIRQFADMIERTPALRSAMHGMMERLTDVTATALAERAGVDPTDPEPQMAAVILMGLWRVQFMAMRRYADGKISFQDARIAILDELRRAAQVADSGLTSFNAVMQRTSTKQQLQEAADAANEARKQVIAAVKKARDAWMQVAHEARAFHDLEEQKDQLKREQRAARQQMRRTIREQVQREQQAMMRQRQAEMQAARRQRRREPPR